MKRLATAMILSLPFGVLAAEDKTSFRIEGEAARGEPIYRKYCAACHGDTGKGDGPAGKRLRPPPYDLSNPIRMNGVTDWEIFTAIKEGGQAVGKSFFMTAWKGILNDQDIHDVAAFVRTLAPAAGEKE